MADDDPIDPLGRPATASQGRVVTMDDAGTVLDDGVVYIESGRIADVRAAADTRPDGFVDAPLVRTGGTIYPGLIELHNHLSYNVIPLWDVPATFVNRDQWAGRDDYRVAVTGPMSVLGRTAGYIEAIVRYVEAKCLLSRHHHLAGHHTELQRRHPPATTAASCATWSRPARTTCPNAATHIADVAAGTAEAFLGQLEIGDDAAAAPQRGHRADRPAPLRGAAHRASQVGHHSGAGRHPLRRSQHRQLPAPGPRRRHDGVVAAQQPAALRQDGQHRRRPAGPAC